MGQPIEVLSTTILGDVALIDTDRSITGQDGTVYSSRDEVDEEFPGRLAAEIFDGAEGITHVFVASNQVVAGREGGWDANALEKVTGIVTEFFVFYAEEAAAAS